MFNWLQKLKFPKQDFKTVGSAFLNKLRVPTNDFRTVRRAVSSSSLLDKLRTLPISPAPYVRKGLGVIPKVGEVYKRTATGFVFGDVKEKGIAGIPEHLWEIERGIIKIPFQFGKTLARMTVGEKAEKGMGDIPGLGEIQSYNKKIEDKYLQSRQQGMSDNLASAVSILGVGGEMILDATILSGFIREGMKSIAKNIKVPLKSQTGAWEELGKAKTLKEAKVIRNELQSIYHPNSANAVRNRTVDVAKSKEITNAYKILEKSGIPKNPAKLSVDFKKTVDILEKQRKLKTFKLGDISKEFRTAETPYLGVRGLLPEQAGTMPISPFQARRQPAGLSIRDIEAKPIRQSDKYLETISRPKATEIIEKGKIKPPEIMAIEKIGQAQNALDPNLIIRKAEKLSVGKKWTKREELKKSLRTDAIIKKQEGMNELYKNLEPKFKIGDVVEVEHKGLLSKTKVRIDGADFNMQQSMGQGIKTGFPSSFRFDGLFGKNLNTGERIVIYSRYKVNGEVLSETLKKNPEKILQEYIKSKQVLAKPTSAEIDLVYKAEIEKEAAKIKREVEGDLFSSIKELGGIKSFKGGFLAEEMSGVPLNLRNNKTGSTMDELATELSDKGYNFDSGDELREAILAIRTEAKPTIIKTTKALRIIEKVAPKKAEVSKRLINKLHRLKYPKVSPTFKAVRRAAEAGKEVGEMGKRILKTGKPIRQAKKEKVVEPETVPIKTVSGFNNFIDLNKIKVKNIPHKKMDIAELVRGDIITPAIRRSGFYATKEIQTAPVRDIYNQKLSPHLMALKQDGYKLGGKFGTVFSKIWKPIEKAIRAEKEFKSKNAKVILDLGKKYKIKATKKNLEYMSDVVEKKVKRTPNEELYVKDLRKVLDDLRKEVNVVGEIMGKDKIGYIENYIPHIQKANIWSELLSNKATISDNLSFIIPNQVKNPFAYKRMLEEMMKPERNLYTLLDRYIGVIGKDIYYTPAIENIKAYNGVLKAREKIKAAQYWDEYIRTGLIGKQHKIDLSIGMGVEAKKVSVKWNDMVNKAFLTGKVAWNIATQPLSYLMPGISEIGVKNSVKGIYKGFSKPMRQYVKENSNVLNIKSSDVHAIAVGEGRNIQSRIYRTKIDKWNDFISMIGAVEERLLTRASYIGGLERAKGLGYKGDDALWFADLSAAKSQSMYNRENRALILNSDITRTIFPFQSFSIEMYNHAKEVFTKAGGAYQLSGRQRVGKLFGLIVGMYLANKYSEVLTGKGKTTIGTFVPFIGGTVIDPMIARMKGEQYYGGRSPITVIQIGEDIIKGSRDYLNHGSTKRLRKIGINFGLALGGIGGGGQINNLIDGIIANIDEDVKNVSGNVMFEVKDLESKIKAPIFGVWATKEGIEYWQPKEKTEYDKAVSEDKEKDKEARERIKPIYDEIQKLKNEGKDKEAKILGDKLSNEEYEIYKKIRTADKTKDTNKKKEEFYPTFLEIRKTGEKDKAEAMKIINRLTKEEYRIYELLKAQLGTQSAFYSAPKDLPQTTRNRFLRLPENPSEKQIAYEIKYLQDRGDVLKKAPPQFTVRAIIDLIRDKLPFLKSSKTIGTEKALKREVIERYNFTDIAKKEIEKMDIRDASPIIEPVLGLIKEGRGIKPYGGKYSPAQIDEFKKFGSMVYGFEKKEFIENVDLKQNITAHEMLHHFWDTVDPSKEELLYQEFGEKWEEYKSKDDRLAEYMQSVDDTLDNNPLYEGIGDWERDNERFAYFGADWGMHGLENIPKEFQIFYSTWFK